MADLYNQVYTSRPPIINGLLYPGTYILAGAPKLGKSFLMAQLAYHVSTGTNMWGFPVQRGSVLYLALEDDYGRLQKRLYKMFGVEAAKNLSNPTLVPSCTQLHPSTTCCCGMIPIHPNTGDAILLMYV